MKQKKVIVVGAGIGGLASTLQLAHVGYEIDVYETHSMPGGKLRTVESPQGPVDAGPTVFTLKHIFNDLFRTVGEDMEDHLTLKQERVLARHFWPDGTMLDLSSDVNQNYKALRDFGGSKAVEEFRSFHELSKKLYESFNETILHNPNPSLTSTISQTLKSALSIAPALLPGRTLANLVRSHFSDKRLRQLFSRYATYVGGSPFNSPAILSLIWYAESLGVWKVNGGMHELAKALVTLAKKRDARFHFNCQVSEILISNNKIRGIRLKDGKEIFSDYVIFNGDPNALFTGLLGRQATKLIHRKNVQARSLSAYVWTFAASVSSTELTHHNVFFNEVYKSEFDDISAGMIPEDPTLYVCAQNLEKPIDLSTINKFEIIMNAAPFLNSNLSEEEEFNICQERTFGTLKKMGLRFKPTPELETLTTPRKFSQLFPASNGSLYGLNPQKLMTTYMRPQARTKVVGLYLTGGGVHPGPGIPMALLSGRHAAATIMRDQTLI